MGTYVFQPSSVFSNNGAGGTWTDFAGGTSNAQLVFGINNLAKAVGINNLLNSFNANISFIGSFYLDGSPIPLDVNHLPAGFTPQTCTCTLQGNLDVINYPTSQIYATFFGSDYLWSSGATFTVIPPTISTLAINGFIGVRVVHSSVGFQPSSPSFYGLQIAGTYALVSTPSWVLPTGPIFPGNKVQFTGPTGISQILLTWTDPGQPTQTITINVGNKPSIYLGNTLISLADVVISQQGGSISFYIPYGFNSLDYQSSRSVSVTFVGDGTQFSGSVAAGTLTILFDDPSGIYVLTAGQTNDLLYSRLGNTTNVSQIMLPQEDEVFENDTFGMLNYPYKILSQDDIDEDFSEIDSLSIIATPQVVTVLLGVEIPSPFIKTAFLP